MFTRYLGNNGSSFFVAWFLAKDLTSNSTDADAKIEFSDWKTKKSESVCESVDRTKTTSSTVSSFHLSLHQH